MFPVTIPAVSLQVGSSYDCPMTPLLAERRLRAGRLLVGTAIVLSAFTLRLAVTSFSPLAAEISQELGLSKSYIGVFGMLPAAMFAVSGLIAPMPMVRLGLERTALVAMVATGLGMVARAFAPDGYLLFGFSAVALCGMGVTNIALPPLVKRYFPDRLALVSGLYVTLLQLGTIVPAFVAVPLSDVAGWRESIGIWAVFGFAAALPWLLVVRDRAGHDVADRTGSARLDEMDPDDGHGRSDRDGARPMRVWRTTLGWGMAVLFGGTSLITYTMFAWVPTMLTDAGASKAFAGSMVGVFPIVGLLPSLFASVIVTRLPNPFPAVALCVAGYVAGFLGLYAAPMAAPVLWVVLIGVGMSTFPMALVLINVRSRTRAGSTALSGFTQGVGYVISCFGPLCFGALHTVTGGWGSPMVLLACAAASVAIGGWFACRPGYIEDTRRPASVTVGAL